MRALLQRVSEASVTVDGQVTGRTGPGLLVLACAMQGDTMENVAVMARKIARLRIFSDDAGRMNRAVIDLPTPSALLVSQFTLAADTSRGNRPGFSAAAPPEEGRTLYEALAGALRDQGLTVGTGRFGTHMDVALVNDGPVTIWLDA